MTVGDDWLQIVLSLQQRTCLHCWWTPKLLLLLSQEIIDASFQIVLQLKAKDKNVTKLNPFSGQWRKILESAENKHLSHVFQAD